MAHPSHPLCGDWNKRNRGIGGKARPAQGHPPQGIAEGDSRGAQQAGRAAHTMQNCEASSFCPPYFPVKEQPAVRP